MNDINKQIENLEVELKSIMNNLKNAEIRFNEVVNELYSSKQIIEMRSILSDLKKEREKITNQIKCLRKFNIKAGNYYLFEQQFIYLLNYNDVYFYYIDKDSDGIRVNNSYTSYYFDEILELTSCFTETQDFKDFQKDVQKFLNQLKEVI